MFNEFRGFEPGFPDAYRRYQHNYQLPEIDKLATSGFIKEPDAILANGLIESTEDYANLSVEERLKFVRGLTQGIRGWLGQNSWPGVLNFREVEELEAIFKRVLFGDLVGFLQNVPGKGAYVETLLRFYPSYEVEVDPDNDPFQAFSRKQPLTHEEVGALPLTNDQRETLFLPKKGWLISVSIDGSKRPSEDIGMDPYEHAKKEGVDIYRTNPNFEVEYERWLRRRRFLLEEIGDSLKSLGSWYYLKDTKNSSLMERYVLTPDRPAGYDDFEFDDSLDRKPLNLLTKDRMYHFSRYNMRPRTDYLRAGIRFPAN